MFKWLLRYDVRQIRQIFWIGVVFFTACTGGEATSKNQASLSDSSWVFIGFGAVDAPNAPIPGSEITAVFTTDQLSGASGCNRYGGPYNIEGNTIHISETAQTAMDCPQPLMEQEAQFLGALRQADSFTLSENELVIETAVSPLIFHRLQPLPLENTAWQLTGIAQDGVVISTWVDERITAVFTNGTLSGSGGCSHYAGAYNLDGDGLIVSEITHDEMTCDEERDRREAQFLTALQAVSSYATTQDSLTLIDANGGVLLTFTTAPPPNPLGGVIWELVALETPSGPLPTQGSLMTAQFMEESVAGTGGCNSYAAGYFLAADAYLLLLNDIGHGFENCAGPVQQLENTFFTLMETAESFTIDNDTLTIYSTRGTLSFAVAPFTDYRPPFVRLPDGVRCSRTPTDDPLVVSDKQRHYYCFQSGREMTILIGAFQPDSDGWLTEKAVIVGTEENFTVKLTETVHVTPP